MINTTFNNLQEFLNERCISVNKSKVLSKIEDKYKSKISQYLNIAYTKYHMDNMSCNDVLDMFSDVCSKLLKTDEDKYGQKGINGLVNKILKIIRRVWDRCLSIMLSIGFQVVLFMFNLYTSQSVFLSLVASSVYFIICYTILSYKASTDSSSKWYIPYSSLKHYLSKETIIDYIKSLFIYTKETINKVISWFIFRIDDDEKRTVKVRRRLMLLLVFILILSTFIIL